MKLPPTLPNEERRAGALRATCLLDTAPEERFDRVTRLARQLFEAPSALVSLVDDERQWFKSAQGLSVQQTPREISFCAHAIAAGGPLLVEDTHADDRFVDNPLVIGAPHIRFYAGYPVAAPDGSKIGTLCVFGDRPRSISPEDCATLQVLARMVEAELIGLSPATTDAATGLSNRDGFIRIGQYILTHRRRLGEGLQLLRLHIHNTVSEASFTSLALLLKGCVRGADLVARLAHHELALLLSCPADGVAPAIGRIGRILRKFNSDRAPSERVALTLSHFQDEATRFRTFEEFLAAAELTPQETGRRL